MRCVHDPQYLCASFQKKCGHDHINERYELRKLYQLYRLCKLSDLSLNHTDLVYSKFVGDKF